MANVWQEKPALMVILIATGIFSFIAGVNFKEHFSIYAGMCLGAIIASVYVIRTENSISEGKARMRAFAIACVATFLIAKFAEFMTIEKDIYWMRTLGFEVAALSANVTIIYFITSYALRRRITRRG